MEFLGSIFIEFLKILRHEGLESRGPGGQGVEVGVEKTQAGSPQGDSSFRLNGVTIVLCSEQGIGVKLFYILNGLIPIEPRM